MYQVVVKNWGDVEYKPMREKKFRTYKRAYGYVGNKLQVVDTLSWGGNLKYMFDGYCKKKLIRYGNTYFRRKNLQIKIVQTYATQNR